MKQKILVVDDEKDILRLLEYNLEHEGYEVVSVMDGPEAVIAAKAEKPQLIILDIMLPNMSGTDVLKALKRDPATEKIPVIMLTAKGEEIDRVLGFELGADDYLIKPFSPKELMLRVTVIIGKKKNVTGHKKENICKGPLEIDLDRIRVEVNGSMVDLTATEFRLLLELIKAKGRTLGRETLMRKISTQEEHVTTRTVDSHVRRVRQKLGTACKDCIETVRGVGYRFCEEALTGR